MLAFTIRRLLSTVMVMTTVAVFIFLLLHLSPGDPAAIIVGDNATPAQIDAVRKQLGLDDPLAVQFVRWLSGVLRGDLGISIFSHEPVDKLIGQRIEPTVSLAATTILLAVRDCRLVRRARRLEGRHLDRSPGDGALRAGLLGAGVRRRLPPDLPRSRSSSAGCRCRATRPLPTASCPGCAT